MKHYRYIGHFKSWMGNTFQLEVYCNGFLKAFFLLTAEAINRGNHWQLDKIIAENGDERTVDDVLKCNLLLKDTKNAGRTKT